MCYELLLVGAYHASQPQTRPGIYVGVQQLPKTPYSKTRKNMQTKPALRILALTFALCGTWGLSNAQTIDFSAQPQPFVASTDGCTEWVEITAEYLYTVNAAGEEVEYPFFGPTLAKRLPCTPMAGGQTRMAFELADRTVVYTELPCGYPAQGLWHPVPAARVAIELPSF